MAFASMLRGCFGGISTSVIAFRTCAATFAVIALFVARGDAQLKIMPFGDSRTAGPTSRDCYRLYLDRMMTAAGYSFDFVGSRVGHEWADYPADSVFDVNHEGHWGWPVNNLLRYGGAGIGVWARDAQPDIVIALLGSTDILQESDSVSYKLARTLREISMVIDTLRKVNPSVAIILGNAYPVRPAQYNPQLQAFNAMLPAFVAERSAAMGRLILVDLWTGFNWPGDLVDDWHANQAGSIKVATRWLDALWPFFDSIPPPVATRRLRMSPAPAHASGAEMLLSWTVGTETDDACIYTLTGRRTSRDITFPARRTPLFFPAVVVGSRP